MDNRLQDLNYVATDVAQATNALGGVGWTPPEVQVEQSETSTAVTNVVRPCCSNNCTNNGLGGCRGGEWYSF